MILWACCLALGALVPLVGDAGHNTRHLLVPSITSKAQDETQQEPPKKVLVILMMVLKLIV